MSDLIKVTIDHDEIRTWVEKRGGVPARVKATGNDSDDPAILRIDFPADGSDPNLELISWDEWFWKFEEKKLAFIFEDRPADGDMSYFNKRVRRDAVKDRLEGKRKSSKEREPVGRR